MSHDARALSSHYLNGSRRRWYVATVCMRARPPSRTMVVLCAVTAWPWKRPLGMQAHSAHEVDDARCHLMLPRPGMRWYPCPATSPPGHMPAGAHASVRSCQIRIRVCSCQIRIGVCSSTSFTHHAPVARPQKIGAAACGWLHSSRFCVHTRFLKAGRHRADARCRRQRSES
jgi:hypothetical protein